jgi:hypothetical protein
VPTEIASRRPNAYDKLENEARVAYRLLDRFVGGHPTEIAEVFGHDLDAVLNAKPGSKPGSQVGSQPGSQAGFKPGSQLGSQHGASFAGSSSGTIYVNNSGASPNPAKAEPFLLTELPRGCRAADLVGQLSLDEQDEFEKGLFKALQCLADIGMVHGDVSPHTVRWDHMTRQVQLTDFGYAALDGEPMPIRTAAPAIPGWVRPPTQRFAAHGDDMWAAGQVVLYVTTGRADPAELSSRGPALRSLLDGVFAESVAARPHASALLRRLSARPYTVAPPTEADERFAEGCRKFDETLAQKSRPPGWPGAGPDAGDPGRTMNPEASGVTGRASRQVLVWAACVVVIALAVAVVWGLAL